MNLGRLFIFTFLAIVTLSSCDENKGKAKEIAEQFANAVNNKDKATIFDLFPNAKDMPNMTPINKINVENISVMYDDSTKVYNAFYESDKNHYIVLKMDSVMNMQIIDSYHVFKLDSIVYELALKTGVPVNQLTDIQLCDLMREESGFINGISYGQSLNTILEVESVSFDWDRYSSSPTLYAIIKNKTKNIIKGVDYKIEFFLYYKYTDIKYLTLVAEGKDISAGGRERIQILCDGVEDVGDIGNNTNVEYQFVYNNLSLFEQLLKYGDLNGGEYNFYIEVNQRLDEDMEKLNKLVDIVSKQKLTEVDIKDLLPINLRLLRNSIYAKHGYIFGDKTIAVFFEEKPWYKGKTKDMNKISNEFNENEKYNVKFIKEHE